MHAPAPMTNTATSAAAKWHEMTAYDSVTPSMAICAGSAEKGTDNPEKGTDNPEKGTDNPDKGTDDPEQGTNNPDKGTDNAYEGTDNVHRTLAICSGRNRAATARRRAMRSGMSMRRAHCELCRTTCDARAHAMTAGRAVKLAGTRVSRVNAGGA